LSRQRQEDSQLFDLALLPPLSQCCVDEECDYTNMDYPDCEALECEGAFGDEEAMAPSKADDYAMDLAECWERTSKALFPLRRQRKTKFRPTEAHPRRRDSPQEPKPIYVRERQVPPAASGAAGGPQAPRNAAEETAAVRAAVEASRLDLERRYEADLRAAVEESKQAAPRGAAPPASPVHASGLSLQQLLDLSRRELTPEDYELLLRLDATVAKKTVGAERLTEVAALELGGGCEGTCAVCLADMAPGEKLLRLVKCGHKYHEGCLKPWLESHGHTCPCCQRELIQ